MRTTQRPRIALLLGAAALLAAACTQPEDRITFGGYYFRADAAPIDRRATLADFTVTVRDAAQSLEGARAAGAYEGTRYCIEKFGSSRIDWVVGPDTDPAQLRIVDGRLVFQGTCDPL